MDPNVAAPDRDGFRVTLLYPPRAGGRGTNLVPPVGLLYIGAVLERSGHRVILVDAALQGLAGERLASVVRETRPDVLGMTAFTSDMAGLSRELPLLRSALPDTLFWVGGPHPSSVGRAVLDELPEIDAAFIGEGEESVLEMIEHLRNPDLPVPDGVLTRRRMPGNPGPRHVDDLSKLPLPAWHLAPPAEYAGLPNGVVLRRAPYAPILTTRGCPCACTFCSGHRVTGKTLRHRPMTAVWEEIGLLVSRYGVREIHIEDDNFTMDADYAAEFCREALARSLPVLFSTPNGVRLDTLTDDLLGMMKRAGWYVVHCGIESGSDRVLARVRKNITTAEMRRSIDRVRRHGLQVAGYFILGLPGETEDDILRTIDFARRSGIEWAHFACFLPIPGSADGDAWLRAHPDAMGHWEAFHNTACPAPPEGISRKRMKQLQRRAFLSFYLRPLNILRVLSLVFRRGVASRLLRRFTAYLLGGAGPCGSESGGKRPRNAAARTGTENSL